MQKQHRKILDGFTEVDLSPLKPLGFTCLKMPNENIEKTLGGEQARSRWSLLMVLHRLKCIPICCDVTVLSTNHWKRACLLTCFLTTIQYDVYFYMYEVNSLLTILWYEIQCKSLKSSKKWIHPEALVFCRRVLANSLYSSQYQALHKAAWNPHWLLHHWIIERYQLPALISLFL